MKNTQNTKTMNERFNNAGTTPTIDTFELQRKPMKARSKNASDPRAKEDRAVSQALYLARKYKNTSDYNSTVSDILEQTKLNKKDQAEETIRFSGRYAHSIVFGNDENTKLAIEKELANPNTTKTRAKKLRKQLRDINAKIELGNSLK